MGQNATARLAKRFGITYVLLVLGLSYFAIYPSWMEGGTIIFVVTMVWMLILAAIVSTYALAVVCCCGDETDGVGAG